MMGDEALLYGLVATSSGCVALSVYPVALRAWARSAGAVERYQQGKVDRAVKTLDDLFIGVKPLWLTLVYGLGPLATGTALFLLSSNLLMGLVGLVAGIVVPDVILRQAKALRRHRFEGQLVDALFIFSSSLRAGLSLTQAFEQIELEMGPPASQEFGLMLKAYRLGLPLESALQRLMQRMPCEELQLITTAIRVARETGGDVTHIINQLIGTIRERKKLRDKIRTLTLQGRLQAYIMSGLPVAFAAFVRTFSPSYFTSLLNDSIGRMLVGLAAGLWVVGMVALFKMSRVDI